MSEPTTPYRRFTSDGESLRKGLAMRCFLGVAVGVFFFGLGLMPFGPRPGADAVAGDGANASSPRQPLQWTACPDIPDMECSGLDVPVDPVHPDGRRFTLRPGRLAVLDPTQRKGVLLFIRGGPGAASPRSSAATTARRSMSTSSGVNGMW